MATLKQRKTAHQESQATYPLDSELASFSQNISTLERVLNKLNVEVMALSPDLNRVSIFLSEMISIRAELQLQQIRALQLTNGVADANVVRLQLALNESEDIAKRLDKFAGDGQRSLAAPPCVRIDVASFDSH
jgi:predicted RNase H-like nuclease (RuvC/YqgF family)